MGGSIGGGDGGRMGEGGWGDEMAGIGGMRLEFFVCLKVAFMASTGRCDRNVNQLLQQSLAIAGTATLEFAKAHVRSWNH